MKTRCGLPASPAGLPGATATRRCALAQSPKISLTLPSQKCPALGIPGACFLFGYRRRVGRIGCSGDQQAGFSAPPTQQAVCGNECADTFIVKEATDEAESRRTPRSGLRQEALDDDTRALNERNAAFWNDASPAARRCMQNEMFGFDCRDALCRSALQRGPRNRHCARLAPSAAGALGSKLLGAGGGFTVFLQKRRRGIRERPKNLIHLSVGINGGGSKIALHQPDGL